MIHTLKRKMKEQRGFTLIELLAVIVILGIIAAIAVPSIGNVINKSQDKAKVAEGLQIIQAAKLYVTDHPTDFEDADFTSNSGVIDIPYSTLAASLDHVKDKNFTVKVSNSNGNISYSLSGHESIAAVTTKASKTVVTEQELVDASK